MSVKKWFFESEILDLGCYSKCMKKHFFSQSVLYLVTAQNLAFTEPIDQSTR